MKPDVKPDEGKTGPAPETVAAAPEPAPPRPGPAAERESLREPDVTDRIPGVWADTPVEQLATGLRFTEGPVWVAPEGYLLFSDIPADTIYKWSPGDGLATWRKPSHNSNGLTRDLEGRLVACEHGSRSVTRSELAGPRRPGHAARPTGPLPKLRGAIAERYRGSRLNSPNDVVVKSDGSVWFTDPPYGLQRGQGRELDFDGVFRRDPETGVITLVASGFEKPNGLAFSPDEKVLYVASSDGENPVIRAFRTRPDGTLGAGRVFYDGRGDGGGVHDGLKVDVDGRVYSSRNDVWVFSPEGECLGVIPVPEVTANVSWGDADWKGLYITARRSLYRVRLKTPGIPVPARKR